MQLNIPIISESSIGKYEKRRVQMSASKVIFLHIRNYNGDGYNPWIRHLEFTRILIGKIQ